MSVIHVMLIDDPAVIYVFRDDTVSALLGKVAHDNFDLKPNMLL